MNERELIAHMEAQGVSYTRGVGDRLRVMDASQLPASMRESFDERGFYKGDDVSDKKDEEAKLEEAVEKAEEIDKVLPMGETEKEMTTIGLLNPEGAEPAPPETERHDGEGPAPAAKVSAKVGTLPDGFPHRKELEDAGYGTYAKARKLVARGEGWYKEVPGIGEAKAADVEQALKEE